MKNYNNWLFESKNSVKTISEFKHVIDFFKQYDIASPIANVKVKIIPVDRWYASKPPFTEFDYSKKTINICDYALPLENEYGWLIHEVGHYLDSQGEKKPYLVDIKKYPDYPNAKNEQTPMYYHFKWFLQRGYSLERVLSILEDSYSNIADLNNKTLWDTYKTEFFTEYYNKIMETV